ncbi:hypothetical protein [Paraclostridium sordellii]|uniref:hypothetical protein n=1 Tax=Paraclostridium sordellii TaxID=1505 RepID=UPI000386AA9E|nr:hypothetical protein [Paeniclostridium sordellii]EPZ58053.1 hypothetical protein H476_1537 [[Clostridium] sordellii VPI 9048] [Paeniclostridium sordellii VPI 9048]CEK37383.1 hypothetical protein JGS6382_07151 [[Clostridium] sordellii] [Paeniclostridium sordellii]
MKEKDVDKLLKETLSIEDLPSDELNNKVKFLINQNKKEKELSIWWMPACVSILTSFMLSFFTFVFLSSSLIKLLALLFIIIIILANIILTFVGVKYFDLKKGAVI